MTRTQRLNCVHCAIDNGVATRVELCLKSGATRTTSRL